MIQSQGMESPIKYLSILTLCLLSLCMGQVAPSELKPINLEEGLTHTFEFYENESYIGYCQYTVTKIDVYNEKTAYFIESVVDLDTSEYSIHVDASYIVDTLGICLHYEFEYTLNGEKQTMNADFTLNSVHITAETPDSLYDKTIELPQNTLSLDNNMICQWDIMVSAINLQEGEAFAVSTFAAQPMKASFVRAAVSETTASIKIDETIWECFKVEFSTPRGYTAYVTRDGQLVKLENESGFVITLKE